MPVETIWLSGKLPVPGQDQLGVRATAIRIYGHLVPGVTNVTERVRYFSVHPYAIHLWAKTSASTDKPRFQRMIRRIECLLGTAEKIRAQDSGDESPAIVGSVRITRWLRDQPQPLPGRSVVPIAQLEQDYFQNRWGAFGQYYSGPERDLGIIAWQDGLPRLADPLGRELAVAIERTAARCHLPDLLEPKVLRVDQLRGLAEEMGFHRTDSAERRILRDILFDISGRYGTFGLRRRRTLLLLMEITRQSPEGLLDPIWQVLESSLQGRVSGAVPFRCPPELTPHLAHWRTYTLHESLAFALEVILAVAVEAVASLETTPTPRTPHSIAAHVADLLPRALAGTTFAELTRRVTPSARSTNTAPNSDRYDETRVRSLAVEALEAGGHGRALAFAITLICRILARLGDSPRAYASLIADDLSVDPRRIGLDHLIRYATDHTHVRVRQVLSDLTQLVVNTHLRVATAKLAHNDDFTYKLVYENGHLRKVREVEPAFSSPRLAQAAQMLLDVDLLKRDGPSLFLTADGHALLRSYISS